MTIVLHYHPLTPDHQILPRLHNNLFGNQPLILQNLALAFIKKLGERLKNKNILLPSTCSIITG